MYKHWSDPQPDSLAWLESPEIDSTSGTFAARYDHRCTTIGVSAPAPSRRAPPFRGRLRMAKHVVTGSICSLIKHDVM